MARTTTPAMLMPVGTALLGRGRIAPAWTLTAMAASFAVSLYGVVLRGLWPTLAPHLPLGNIEPIYAGLTASLAVYVAGWLAHARAPEPAAVTTLEDHS